MAYNEELAGRVRDLIPTSYSVEEKNMMGGLTFMVNGKMCLGIVKDDLMARIDPAVHAAALEKTGCRDMDFTGRPMKGFVFIDHEGTGKPDDLAGWVQLSLDFNKKAKASKKRKAKS